MKRPLLTALLLCIALAPVRATVNDALSFAYEAADPYVDQGFTVRQDAWGGDLGVKEQQAVTAQLFRGNEYWFWLATDLQGVEMSVHIYDSEGKLVDADSWQKGRFAAVRVVPKKSGTYYAIVTIQSSPRERTPWALVYGFR